MLFCPAFKLYIIIIVIISFFIMFKIVLLLCFCALTNFKVFSLFAGSYYETEQEVRS